MPQCQSGRSSKSSKPPVRAMELRFGSISLNGRLFQNVERSCDTTSKMTICGTHSMLPRKSLDILLMLLFCSVAPQYPSTRTKGRATGVMP